MLLSVTILAQTVAHGLAACFALVWWNCGLAATLQGNCEVQGVAPLSLVLAQMLWNALQVGVVLLTLWVLLFRRRWVLAPTAAGMFLLLLLSHYVTSPGALLLGALGLTLALSLLLDMQAVPLTYMKVEMLPAEEALMPAKVGCLRVRHDLLCCTIFLFAVVYNMDTGAGQWPHVKRYCLWATKFLQPSWTPLRLIEALYWTSPRGDGGSLPAQVPPGSDNPNSAGVTGPSFVGEVCFVVIWAVYPCLYMGYFAGLLLNSGKAPDTAVQRFLCLCCIAHFLFLTDGVSYSYGRGLAQTPQTEAFHTCEKLVFRLAIFLTLYQKLCSRELRRIPRLGWFLHLFAALFLVAFVVEQVVKRGGGYYRSLVVMMVFYGLLVATSAGWWLVVRPSTEGEEAANNLRERTA